MNLIASCNCGKLQILVSKPPVIQLVCHCIECQVFSGAAFVEGVFFRKDSCHIKGSSRVESMAEGTGSDKHHHFCSLCDTPLYVQIEALNGAIAIAAERLDPFEFAAEVHLWTSQKAQGVEIPATSLQSPGAPPDEIVERMINGFWNFFHCPIQPLQFQNNLE